MGLHRGTGMSARNRRLVLRKREGRCGSRFARWTIRNAQNMGMAPEN